MTDAIILQLIFAVTQFCAAEHEGLERKLCFREIWTCGHHVSDTRAIVTETHNCITKYVK